MLMTGGLYSHLPLHCYWLLFSFRKPGTIYLLGLWGNCSSLFFTYWPGRKAGNGLKDIVTFPLQVNSVGIIFSLCFRCLVVYSMEKTMAPHSSTLAWKIPWAEEPGGLQSMGSLRVRHDWATSLSLFTFMHWRRKWQRTPVFLPGESQGRGSLVGCRLWGRTESDTNEAT